MPARSGAATGTRLIPGYDEKHGAEPRRPRWKNGTQWLGSHFTIQSVTPEARPAPGTLPMPAPEDNADYLRKLITICRGHGIIIGVLMADREL